MESWWIDLGGAWRERENMNSSNAGLAWNVWKVYFPHQRRSRSRIERITAIIWKGDEANADTANKKKVV